MSADRGEAALTDARLRATPSPELVRSVNAIELADELDGIEHYVLMDLAHVTMLTRQGVFTDDHGKRLLEVLLDLAEGDARSLLDPDPTIGTLALQIERYLRRRLGDDGVDVQRARSRIDQKATGWRMTNRTALLRFAKSLRRLCETILERADADDAVLMPGYTHLQHSQPTTVGHYLNAHYWMSARNLDRALDALRRVNRSSLGGAAYSGTSWNIDRDLTASYLGFDDPLPNARDAGMASIDLGAELASVLSLGLSGASRLASDLNYWASSEVGLLELDASLCGTSSMMPQKRNPMALERVRALAGSAAGWTASQLGVLHTSTSTDADQAYVHNLIPAQCEDATGAINLLSEAVATMRLDVEAMRRSAGRHWSTASALADRLVLDHDLSFRSAHDLVARFIAAHADAGLDERSPRGELADPPLSHYTHAELSTALDPDAFVESRTSAGGTSAANRARLAAEAASDLAELGARIDAFEARIADGRARLLDDARRIAGRT
jgi:argininosuccinate lyase